MSEPYLWRDLLDGAPLEHRSDIVIEGKGLLCGTRRAPKEMPGHTPTERFQAGPGTDFPMHYVEALIQEAQDALRQVVGVRHALVTITVRVSPYALPLELPPETGLATAPMADEA